MQTSTILLVLCLQLVLAKSSLKLDDHDLNRRLYSVTGKPHLGSRTRRSLIEREYQPSNDYASAAVETSYQARPTSSDSYVAVSSVIGLTGGYTSPLANSAAPAPVESLSFSAAQAAPTSSAPMAVPSSPPPLLKIPSSPSCDKTHTKSEINRLLIESEAQLKIFTDSIQAQVKQVTKDNVEQIGSQILTNLKEILALLKLSLSSVQICGTDAKPLSTDKGVALSDVSWSAFQVVLTLKGVFQSISGLYKPFPVIKTLCSDSLLAISTALASLIGACGEQINLFDTRFFPLVTPQLEEFTGLADNFVSFVGSFTS